MRPIDWVLVLVSLVAFASNSILCRLAMKPDLIDPAGFTGVRLLSYALILSTLALFRKSDLHAFSMGRWSSGFALFVYAIAFSYAYVRIDAGVGALILFAAVQITMVVWNYRSRSRMTGRKRAGLGIAMVGLAWFTLPGKSAPGFEERLVRIESRFRDQLVRSRRFWDADEVLARLAKEELRLESIDSGRFVFIEVDPAVSSYARAEELLRARYDEFLEANLTGALLELEDRPSFLQG